MADKITLFGKPHELIGSSTADLILKTRGGIKILWGNKFIDLIKNGEINAKTSFIFKVKDEDSIGVSDGIYILDSGDIYLKIGDEKLNIFSSIGNTFVSFMGELKTDSESKYRALTNIGFLYSDLSKVDTNSLQNGIIYIESELKLYIVKDGTLSEFFLKFPNPFTELFIIAKNDSDIGSLLILGSGIENSVAFEYLYIYNDNGLSYILSDSDLIVQIGLEEKFRVSDYFVEFKTKEVIGKMFKSKGANIKLGFRLYLSNNLSTLEIDNLILRNPDSLDIQASLTIYPQYWYYNTNIISNIILNESNIILNETEDSEEELSDEEESYLKKYTIYLKYKNTYQVGECIYIIIDLDSSEDDDEDNDEDNEDDEGDSYHILSEIPLIVKEVDGDNITVEVSSEFIDKDNINSLIGLTTFSIGNKENAPVTFLRRSYNNLDLVESSNFEEEKSVTSVKTRFGDLSELDLKISENNLELTYDKKYGIYSENGIFLNAAYQSGYKLDKEDHSSRFASTEWVNTILGLFSVNPGYYWSKDIDSNTPVNPIYIGTTSEDFEVSESLPYLWYTNDGKVWMLKKLWIAPDPNRYYILSTNLSRYSDEFNKLHKSPAGFICYYKDGNSIECGYGKSNYVSISYNSTVDLSKLPTLLNSAELGNIPSKDGYIYLWSIASEDDKTIIDNWRMETSFGYISDIQKVVNNVDWGNLSNSPGWTVWEVDDDNKIVGTPSSSVYIEGVGNLSNWNNEIWRLSFLRSILREFLAVNEINRYNIITGWNMDYEGAIFCSGFGGVFTARIGGLKAPTSDDPNDIGYKPTCILSSLIGYTTGHGYLVEFDFENVELGEKYNNLCEGLTTRNIGDKLSDSYKKYFKVSYDTFYVNIKKMSKNTVTVE